MSRKSKKRTISGIRIGTRSSMLAIAQARIIADALYAACPRIHTEIVPFTTSGDRRKGPLAPVGGKGLFTAELENALRNGDIDIAVHSAKDMPAEMSPEFVIAAVPQREDPCDVLVSRSGSIEKLPADAAVGTSSPRRRAQLLAIRGDLKVVPIRGNVDTRLARVLEPARRQVDATVLALAGIRRAGLETQCIEFIHRLDVEQFTPAAGQGALAVQTLADNSELAEMLAVFNDAASREALEAEREIIRRCGADCHSCIGVHAARVDNSWRILLMAARSDGSGMVKLKTTGSTCGSALVDMLNAMADARVAEAVKN